jgi:hypothetical protein
MEVRRVLTRLQCLKEDLRIPDATWRFSVKRLLESLDYARQKDPKLMDFVSRWLAFASALSKELQAVSDPHRAKARRLFAEYLTELVELTRGTADPWAPFVMGHELDDESLVTFRRRHSMYGSALSRRGSVVVKEDPSRPQGKGYQRRTLELLGELAEFGRERRYEKLLKYLQIHGLDETGGVAVDQWSSRARS